MSDVSARILATKSVSVSLSVSARWNASLSRRYFASGGAPTVYITGDGGGVIENSVAALRERNANFFLRTGCKPVE